MRGFFYDLQNSISAELELNTWRDHSYCRLPSDEGIFLTCVPETKCGEYKRCLLQYSRAKYSYLPHFIRVNYTSNCVYCILLLFFSKALTCNEYCKSNKLNYSVSYFHAILHPKACLTFLFFFSSYTWNPFVRYTNSLKASKTILSV